MDRAEPGTTKVDHLEEAEKVRQTMVNGRHHDAAPGDELAPRSKKRGRFWWG